MANFVIVTTQRSGSTWLVSVLNQHPQIACYEEPFLSNAKSFLQYGDRPVAKWARYSSERGMGPIERRMKLAGYLDLLLEPPGATKRSRGFKVMTNQLVWTPDLLLHLARRKLKVIHLWRENVFAVVASLERLRHFGQAHYCDRPESSAYEVRLHRLKHRIWARETRRVMMSRALTLLSRNVMEVSYEDMVRDPETFRRITAFVGEDPSLSKLSSDLKRISSGDYRREIANFASVERALAGSRFARYLELDKVPRAR